MATLEGDVGGVQLAAHGRLLLLQLLAAGLERETQANLGLLLWGGRSADWS